MQSMKRKGYFFVFLFLLVFLLCCLVSFGWFDVFVLLLLLVMFWLICSVALHYAMVLPLVLLEHFSFFVWLLLFFFHVVIRFDLVIVECKSGLLHLFFLGA